MARKTRPTLRSIASSIINKIRERLDKYEKRGFDTQELRKNLKFDKLEEKKRFTQKDVKELRRKSSSNYMRTKVEVKTDEGEYVKGLKAFKYIKARDEVKHLSTAEEIGIRLDNIEDNMPYIKPSDLERRDGQPDEENDWLSDYLQQKAELDTQRAQQAIEEISKPTRVWNTDKTFIDEPSIFYNMFTELRDTIGDEDFNIFLKANEEQWINITENFYQLSYYKDAAKEMFSSMITKMPKEFQQKLKDYRLKTENTIAPDQGQLLKPETDFAKAWEESNAFKALGTDSIP